MNRDKYLTERRNKAICQAFYTLLRQGMPAMRAYATVGEQYWLSENHIRRIIAHYAQQKEHF